MKNKQKWIIPLTAAGIVILFMIIFFVFSGGGGNKLNYETKTSGGEVVIDLTPNEYKYGKLYVGINVNTHTVDLEQFNLKQLTTLNYSGTSIRPEQAPELKGHHNSGVLVFNVGKEVKGFSIIIMGVPDINE